MLKSFNSASESWLNAKALALVWLGVVLSLLLMLSQQWLISAQSPLETDILKLLPKSQQNPVAEQAFEAISSDFSDKLVFVVTAEQPQQSFDAAAQLAQSLEAMGLFSEVIGEIGAEQQSQWAAYYFNQRFQQLTDAQRQRLRAQPELQVQQVIQSIYSPFSGVTGEELRNDPFLLFRDYLAQLSQANSGFTLSNGFLATEHQGQTYVLVSTTLKDSPYSLQAQQGVAEILHIEQTIAERYQATSYHTGVLFYAEFGTQSAKSEISTIGVFSLLGVIVLIAAVFRSLVPLSLALLSICIGLLAALVVTTWVFGSVHLFSLVFGASLIGVSIDYAFHYLTEHLAAGDNWDSRKGLKHIFAAITMGLLTSLIGYLGMLIAPFPGLQQLALFSSIGLFSAYITVVAWYPVLAVKPCETRPLPGQWLLNKWLMLWSLTPVKVGLPTLCLLAAIIPLSGLQYDDDIRQLQALPEGLKQQEQLISDLSGVQQSQQMLVVTAETDELLMQRLESLSPTFSQWQQQGILSSYKSLAQYHGSMARQQQDYQLIEQLYQGYGHQLSTALQLREAPSLGYDFNAVSLQQYLSQIVSEPVRVLYVGAIDEQVASVIVLNQLSQPELIKVFADAHDDISYLNKTEEISELFAEYRSKVMELLLLALTVITALLIKRYRLKHAILIIIPSLIGCVAGLAAATALGSSLNLFNLLALILIVGIGIDYTLFFAEKARSQSTLLAITLSAITTLLSFGLLSFSQTHAIHSFGITVLSGIFISWLLSPLAINLREKG